MAHHLIGLGVGPETLVGVALERCMEMVMALLGILKAGGAYLPLDPDYPEARLAYMLADAALLLVISSATLRRRLPETVAVIKESSGPPHSPRGSRSHLLEVNGFVVAGRLHLDWTYSQRVHRWATVERLARGFLEALEALIAHCRSPEAGGFTPSDFPGATLSQENLDKFITRIKQARRG